MELSEFSRYTYAALMLGTISFPLVRSFEPRVHYAGDWKFIWPGMPITAFLFIAWDIWFTAENIWAFNPQYVLGIYGVNLPIEEWIFFFSVPFACIFIYRCVEYFELGKNWKTGVFEFSLVLGLALLTIAVLNHEKRYTAIKLSMAGIGVLAWLYFRGTENLNKLWITMAFVEIPFLLVNGVLTYLPVVTYNPQEFLGIRYVHFTGVPLFNIPIEDTFYGMLLILMNIWFFDFFRAKANKKALNEVKYTKPATYAA